MATRFYLETTIAAAVNPAFDAGWEQTGQAIRRAMRQKLSLGVVTALGSSGSITVPITTTKDILCYQFVSDPIRPRIVTGSCSFVMNCLESATTANVNLAAVLKAVSVDGATIFGTLFSVFGTDTEFPITTAASRFWVTQALTLLDIQDMWRLVLEIGAHAAAPTAGTTYTMRAGFGAAADLAYSTGVTTDNNPSLELSETLFGTAMNNFQFLRTGDGMSSSERIR